MLGTILIVILILALVGHCPAGRTAGNGVMPRPEVWDSSCLSLSYFYFSGASEPCAIRQPHLASEPRIGA